MPRSSRPIVWACLAATLAGCASSDRLSISHRRTSDTFDRIVVLPVALPANARGLPESEERTLASLYASELLRSYDILEFERFAKKLEKREVEIESVLEHGIDPELSKELAIDGLLISDVYSWTPGAPGILFFAKNGRIGFLSRLVDVDTGSVIWSVNRVGTTAPGEPLSVAIGRMFADVVSEMPRNLNRY